MTQLSRKQKYQELRDRLDEETTAAQAQPVKLQRLSRVDSGSHANKPLYPHDTVRVSPTVKEMPTSPVMEDLLGEVKQYNIDNGNRITDDTQINILKQLDSSSETRKRNQHVIPMETDDEDLGSTMKISKPKTIEFERPVRQEPKEEKIILTSDDVEDVKKQVDDNLDLMFLSGDDFDKTEEQQKNEKKKKSKRKKEKRDELESMPSAKMRMKTSDFEKASKKGKKGSEIVLNVVLGILILALVAIIGYLVWTFKNI